MQSFLDNNHVKPETISQPFFRRGPILNRVVVIGAIGAILIALLGLLGYVPGLQILGRIREGYIPMAPSTAFSFIVLGGILATMALRSVSNRNIFFLGALAVIVSLFGVLEVVGYFTGIDLNFENALVPSAGYLGDVPIARMSPSTGAGFFIAGLAVFALLLQQSKTPDWKTSLGNWGGSLGSLVLGISLVFSLAYFWGSPMLYGQGATIPMALSTAIAFLMLGAAIVGTSGEEAVPVRLFTGGWHSAKAIGERGRILLLTFIMVISCGMVMMIILVMLYRHNIDEHRNLLVTTVQSQARLIEAVAQYDSDMSITLSDTDPDYDAFTATLGQIIDAHERYQGFGETGEFTLARREGNSMVFILRHRLESIERPEPVDFNSNLAEPMRRALSGLSGTIIDLDYRGETVLAAYEPVSVLNLGIVAKIDIKEIRSPFIWTGLSAVAIAFFVILAGTTLFFKISSPMIEKLEAYSLNLSLIHETIDDMLFQLDVEPNDVFRFATVNRAFLEKTGLTEDQIIGKTVEEVISEESLDLVLGQYRKAISEKKMVQWEETSTYPMGTLTGIVTISPSFDKQGECSYLIGSVHDITERKRLEEQFHHSQRMEAVGRLAGGIAHDFNNVLTVISGNAQMGLNMLQEDTPLYERLTTVIKAANHAGDLTSKLLAFGRKQIIAPKVLDLNSVLVGMYPVLRRLITEEIDLAEKQGSYLGMILM